MVLTIRRAAAWMGVGMVLTVGAWPARGQEAAPPAPDAAPAASQPAEPAAVEGKDVAALWNDMIDYIGVARPDVAKTYAEALLKHPEAANQVFLLASKNPKVVMATLTRAARDKGLKPAVDQIMALIEEGYTKDRSDANRIGQAIKLLFGTSLEYELGAKRLEESGEYAVPQLIQAMRSAETPEGMKDRVATFLPRLKLAAVRPLSEVLQTRDLPVIERVATVLGQIGYPHASAMLKAVLERPEMAESGAGQNVAKARRVVQAALVACGGQGALQKSAAQLYNDLGEQYYYQAESLRPAGASGPGNVWYWAEDLGLSYKPAPREIFCDVYAMRCARTALKLDPKLAPAVSLWLAAYIKKEALLPAGATDPTAPEDRPPAKFYSLAAGAKYLQEVLARGLKDKDVPVAVGAIEALARTAGAKSLVIPASGGTQPLVEAMSFPDGRVRFLAAVTLASALPQERFAGWEKVVPALDDAILMTGGKARSVLVGDGSAASNNAKGLLRAGGWEVLDSVAAGAAIASAQAVGGADLIVIVNNEATAASMVGQFRKEPTLAKASVVILAKESPALAKLAQEDKAVNVLPPASADETVIAAFAAARPAAGGGLPEEQAAQWAVRAANCIRLLAETDNKVFEVQPAMGPLMEALNDKRAEVRLAAAGALAVMPAQAAQQAIARLALAPDLDENVRVSALNTACESVRRFGDMFAQDQKKGVLDLVKAKGSADVRDAAAQLLGALSLPSEMIQDLIQESGEK